MTHRANLRSRLILPMLFLLIFAALTPGTAEAFKVAIYVDGFRVGEFDTWDPHWWINWFWGGCSANLGDDGTGISIGLAEGTIDEVLRSHQSGGRGSTLDFYRSLLEHPANRALYAEAATESPDPGKERPRPPEWVEIELAEADETALPTIVMVDDLAGLAARPDIVSITVRKDGGVFQPCVPGVVGWVAVLADPGPPPLYYMQYCPGEVQ